MKVLVVGGGVAGLTLAAKLLRQEGREVTLVERAAEYAPVGFGIGLYPLGSCVLHGLGVYEEYLEACQTLERYVVADHRARRLQSLDMSVLVGEYGPMLMSTRAALIEVLRRACDGLPIRLGTTVESIEARDDGVECQLSDGSGGRFDVVAGCDGLGSEIRSRVFGQQPGFDTGWTAWTWWGREGLFPPSAASEYWGPGFFFGVYPVPEMTTFVAVVPDTATREKEDAGGKDGAGARVLPLLREIFAGLGEAEPAVAEALAEPRDLYAWRMNDVRSRVWVKGRAVLVGDAAVGFLPTAGVGASNALRAAAGLADELSRADAATAPLALRRYERRCRPVVEANQSDSRRLARLMFVRSRAAAWCRNRLLRHYPPERLVSSIRRSMEQPF